MDPYGSRATNLRKLVTRTHIPRALTSFFPGTIPKVWGGVDLLDEPVEDAGPRLADVGRRLADVGRRPCIDDSVQAPEHRKSFISTGKNSLRIPERRPTKKWTEK